MLYAQNLDAWHAVIKIETEVDAQARAKLYQSASQHAELALKARPRN